MRINFGASALLGGAGVATAHAKALQYLSPFQDLETAAAPTESNQNDLPEESKDSHGHRRSAG